MLKRTATTVGAGLAAVALLAGCGNAGTPDAPPVESASTAGPPTSETAQELAVPDQVVVCQPGLVDTTATVDDVPAWPGPAPSEFMEPTPPSGACGTLTGEQAQVAYDAAVQHPAALLEEGRLDHDRDLSDTTDALWASEGVVAWIVVEPRW